MSLPRYCAILGGQDPFAARRVLEERALGEAGMRRILSAPGLTIVSDAAAPLLLSGGGGAILGPIHSREQGMPRMTAPGEEKSRTILRSRGDHLVAEFWGDYVAFLQGTQSRDTVIVRAPFGALQCLHLEHRGLHIFASDLAMLQASAHKRFEHDWTMLAVHLAAGGLRQKRSCVVGIEELLWGMRFTVSQDSIAAEPCWSPWHFTNRKHLLRDSGLAAVMLRDTALGCIAAQTRELKHLLVMLSGGLDSSILACCAAASGVPVTCLTLTTGDTIGDERHYAALVARALDVQLHEAALEVGHVDITRSQAAGLVRPTARAFAQAMHHQKQRIAHAAGAQAVYDGGGGDNLFCFLQSVTPVADRLRMDGPSRGAWRTMRSMAQLAETSVVTVGLRAAQRAWLRPPGWRWPLDSRFLTSDALICANAMAHRWLAAPRDTLPGSAAHVALLITVENLLETTCGPVPERSPLIAQPLVELCLSIPSWFWCAGGYNRAIARQAFAPMLPPEIAWRRSKGAPDHFVAALYEANRTQLADFLADGLLASQGLLDRSAILAELSRTSPIRGHNHVRLLKIADTEAWARGLQI